MKQRLCALVLLLGLLVTNACALTAEQAKKILSASYIDEISPEVLAQPTIEGLLAALGDPYTTYYDAESYAAFLGSMEDTELVGIGIRCNYLAEGVLVNQVAPDSPALEAGLEPGDYIIAIDGNDTRGAAEEDIDSWIRGDEGTGVTLTILRGEEVVEAAATRRYVVFPTVILEKIENQVGWIRCDAFGSTTFSHFYDIISAHDHQVQGWVVDLRENTGGNVYAALFSAGCFAGEGQGTYLRSRNGRYASYINDPALIAAMGYYDGELSAFDERGFLTEAPVYVLTSGHTASAAELFCALVRDSGAGLIIGERTYGKGVAQSLYSQDSARWGDYFPEGDALKVTTERVFSEAGATNDRVGIFPHFLVEADLADEAAALLAAPVSEEDEPLYLCNLSDTSNLVDDMVMPLELLRQPENAQAAAALLSALPANAWCMLALEGNPYTVTRQQAAASCGVTLDAAGFTDLEGAQYADEIDTLSTYGIVSGPGDGAFLPDAVLDRASLCALLAKAMRFTAAGTGTAFADVSADSWYAPYVDALYHVGLVKGNDGLFRPEEAVTHEEVLTILGRLAQWLDMNYYELARHDGIYGDLLPGAEELSALYPGYSAWAREQVWLLDNGFIWGDLTQTDPAAPTTRAEAAGALYHLFLQSGVLHV